MKYRLQHIFLTAPAPSAWLVFALCLALTACGLEEPVDTPSTSGGYIEFVARPTGFNNQTVATKSTSAPTNQLETLIANYYLLIFDNSTKALIYNSGNLGESLVPCKIDVNKKDITSVTACFIANVSETDVNKFVDLDKLQSGVLDITYATYDEVKTYNQNNNYGSNGHLVIPKVNNVPCIPMFGVKSDIDLTSRTVGPIQIPIKRLFSKISLNLSMDLDDLGTLNHLEDSYFTLQSYKINNLPIHVSLFAPSTGDSQWANGEHTEHFTSSLVSLEKQKIYNKESDNSPKTFTCEFYVPEYFLQALTEAEYYSLSDRPEGTYGTQMYKPLSYSADKHPMYLTLTGVFEGGILQENIGLKYDIYLGGDESTDFTLLRNTNYINAVKITGFDNSDIDHRVTVTSGSDMTEIHGQVANCYIISEPGEYTILAYKGAHKYSDLQNIDAKYICTKGTNVKVKYKDSDILRINSDDFIVDKNEDGIIEITFTSPSILGMTAAGNMVIDLVYEENETEYTEWSWHLWFVPNVGVGSSDFIELGSHTMPDANKSTMIDRNIGVTALTNVSSGIGAYYKYGCKEPYFNADDNKISDSNTGYNPYGGGIIEGYTPTWNTTAGKSLTDPCPPGYKVPSSSVWTGYTPTDTHSSNPYSYLYYTGVNYPYSGYLSSSNSLEENSSTSITLEYTGNLIEYKTISSPNPAGIYRRYRNITYKVPLTLEIGYVHGTDSTLYYNALTSTSGNWLVNLFSSFDISYLEWQEGSVSNTGSFFRPNYVLSYPDSWKSLSEIGLLENANYEAAKRGVIKSALQTDIQNKGIEYSESDLVNVNNSNSYQVRCQKE